MLLALIFHIISILSISICPQIYIAASREAGISYSQLMGKLRKASILLDRKVLSELTATKPEIFKAVVAKVK